jgi:hypothetical protein
MSDADSVAARIIAKLDPGLRRRIALDPFAAACEDFRLDLVALPEPRQRGEGGSCDGFSFLDTGIIYYRPTWSDRQFFTVTHELAHLLIEADDDAIDWVTSQPGAPQLEDVCDAVASRLLIPDELLAALGSPPTARHLALIHDTTSASRSACAVRLAQRLPCEGFIVIVDALEQSVFFAARHEDTRPYAWQGDPIPNVHHLRHIEDQRERKVESWWPYPNGERVRFYLNAYRDGDRIFAIFAERDLWQVATFHAPEQRQRDERPELELHCPDCGYDGRFRGYPWSDCRQPYCPQCKRCDCDRRRERSAACKSCGLEYVKHLLDDTGVCVDCR